jgi:GNAT superfamily N-acetyltransferase
MGVTSADKRGAPGVQIPAAPERGARDDRRMRVTNLDSAGAFLAATGELRDAEPIVTNVISTLADGRASGRVPGEPGDRWLVVTGSDGRVVGAAVRTVPRALLLSPMPADAADAVAAHAAGELPELPGFDGPKPTSQLVARRYAALTHASVTPGLDMRILATSTVRDPGGVPGQPRRATGDDRELLRRWIPEFSLEAVPHQPAPTAEMIDKRLAGASLISLWIVDGRPVSLCWESAPAGGVVRVSAVYTPPELRGHGYASANVAAATRRALDDGARACMLYTDSANPTSNKVYERIGYTHVGDAAEWLVAR